MRLPVDILKHRGFENCDDRMWSLQVHLLAGNECVITRRKTRIVWMNACPTNLFNRVPGQFSITLEHFCSHSAFPLEGCV